MFEQMKWKNVYDQWKTGYYQFSELLFSTVSAEI